MTFFEDLSAYSYLGEREIISVPRGFVTFTPTYARLNVGWLGRTCRSGPVAGDFVDALREVVVAGSRFNVTRGFHSCEICRGGRCAQGGVVNAEEPVLHGLRGNGEIRVPGGSGVVFAAPVMVWHYVSAHGYQPPAGFVTAVMSFVASGGHVGEPSWVPADAERLLY